MSDVTPLSGLRLSPSMVTLSLINSSFFADFAIVKKVNGNFVDVEHAVISVMNNGVPLPVTETRNVELLFPSAASYGEKFPIAQGDGVLLIGLRNYIPTVNGLQSPTNPPTLFFHYTQNTMKAIPLGSVSSPKVTVTVDANGNYTLANTNSTGNVHFQAQSGKFQIKNMTQSLFTILNSLISDLQTIFTADATKSTADAVAYAAIGGGVPTIAAAMVTAAAAATANASANTTASGQMATLLTNLAALMEA